MVRHFTAALALTLTLSSAEAARVLEQPERPYELALSDVNLPSSAGGGVSIQPCETCPYSTHVLTSATRFLVNGTSVSFEEFSRIAAQLRTQRQADRTFVGLFVAVDSGRVTRITLQNSSL